MKCQITETPEQQIDPPKYENDASHSPEELVKSYLDGDKNSFIDLNKVKDYVLSSDFKGFISLYRHFKFDPELTIDENRGELLELIDEYLTESILWCIK